MDPHEPDREGPIPEGLYIAERDEKGVPACRVLTLQGLLDTNNSDYLRARARKAIAAGYTKLVLDLHELEFITSTGIGVLSALTKEVRPLGGDVVLIGVKPRILEILQLMGFSRFLEIREEEAEAIAYFSRDGDRNLSGSR